MEKHQLYNHTGLSVNNKSHVLYALVDKQNQIKFLIEEYQDKLNMAKDNLSSIEQTICIFDNNCEELIKSKRTKRSTQPKKKYFNKGECKKLILTTLRTATRPLKTNEVAYLIRDVKNIKRHDVEASKDIQKIIGEILRVLEKGNLVYRIGKDGSSVIWSIKPLSTI